jgi:hypothetical protein
MTSDDDKQSTEAPTNPSAVEPAKAPLDEMRQTVEEEKKGIEELDAKIQEAKEHAKQLHRD